MSEVTPGQAAYGVFRLAFPNEDWGGWAYIGDASDKNQPGWERIAQAAIDAATEGTIRALGFTLADIGRFIEAQGGAQQPQPAPGLTATEELRRFAVDGQWLTCTDDGRLDPRAELLAVRRAVQQALDLPAVASPAAGTALLAELRDRMGVGQPVDRPGDQWAETRERPAPELAAAMAETGTAWRLLDETREQLAATKLVLQEASRESSQRGEQLATVTAARDEYRDNAILHVRELDEARAGLENQVARGDRLEGQKEDLCGRVAKVAEGLERRAQINRPSKVSEVCDGIAADLRKAVG